MNRQLKVYMVPYKMAGAVFRGETKILNFPTDGQVLHHHDVEQLCCRTGVALLVHSATFPAVPQRDLVPVVNAVFAKEA